MSKYGFLEAYFHVKLSFLKHNEKVKNICTHPFILNRFPDTSKLSN